MVQDDELRQCDPCHQPLRLASPQLHSRGRKLVREMDEKEKIFAEISVLLQEQIETLRVDLLGPYEIAQYGERQKRIKELVEWVGQQQEHTRAN